MAAEHEDHEDQAPEHGAPPATGKHKGKIAGLIAGPHRDAILVVCSVVGVLLMWLTFRRTSDSSGSGAMTSQLGPTQAAQVGLSSGSVAGSDASALLGFQTLLANQSDQIQQINQSVQGILSGSTPDQTPSALSSPVAAGMFTPNYNGNYVRYANGGIAEVESDGSLFGFTLPQWAQAYKVAGANGVTVNQLSEKQAPSNWNTQANLDAAAAKQKAS